MNFKFATENNKPEYIVCLLLCCFSSALFAGDSSFSKEELEWLDSDQAHPAKTVNEGVLNFLVNDTDKAGKPEHHHENNLWIDRQTIRSGWARLEQCHTHLDAVPALQILYHRERIRDLKILSKKNIADAEALQHRVVLHGIQENAKICIKAQTRAFRPDSDQHYILANGPFMRKFLDGYYPIKVSLNIHYPESLLKLVSIRPAPQTGWHARYQKNQILLGGRFEGELRTQILFQYLPEQ